MGAPSKRARKIRTGNEFDTKRLKSAIATPKDTQGSVFSWSLADIANARDAQMRGQFMLAARLAESMRTDDACAVAFENRLAPQRCLSVALVPAKGARGLLVAGEAEALFGQKGVGIHPDTMADVNGCLVNHEVAFGYNVATPREDGSRVDVEMKFWPIEFVRWDPFRKCFITRMDFSEMTPEDLAREQNTQTESGIVGALGSYEVPIVHGDGRWVIFKKHEVEPFKYGAILAACLVWARHAYALRDWAKGSVSHGSPKILGTMPEGMALQLQDGTGGLTPEAASYLDLLQALSNGDTPSGIQPFGAETELITNNSTAWQVWNELTQNAERAAARIYLGTDGTLGSRGGAPGVDIESLFGVASTKVQGDLACIERGILTGVIEPWCAMNFGDSSLAPSREYQIPDDDADAKRKSLADRTSAFWAAMKGAADAHVRVDQAYIDKLAESLDVLAPVLPVAPVAAPEAPPATSSLRSVR